VKQPLLQACNDPHCIVGLLKTAAEAMRWPKAYLPDAINNKEVVGRFSTETPPRRPIRVSRPASPNIREYQDQACIHRRMKAIRLFGTLSPHVLPSPASGQPRSVMKARQERFVRDKSTTARGGLWNGRHGQHFL